jgi:hypothetical protein
MYECNVNVLVGVGDELGLVGSPEVLLADGGVSTTNQLVIQVFEIFVLLHLEEGLAAGDDLGGEHRRRHRADRHGTRSHRHSRPLDLSSRLSFNCSICLKSLCRCGWG